MNASPALEHNPVAIGRRGDGRLNARIHAGRRARCADGAIGAGCGRCRQQQAGGQQQCVAHQRQHDNHFALFSRTDWDGHTMAMHEDFLRGDCLRRGERRAKVKSNHGAVLGGTGSGRVSNRSKVVAARSHRRFGAISGVKEDGGRASASVRHRVAGRCSVAGITSLTNNYKTETVAPARRIFGRRNCNRRSVFANRSLRALGRVAAAVDGALAVRRRDTPDPPACDSRRRSPRATSVCSRR